MILFLDISLVNAIDNVRKSTKTDGSGKKPGKRQTQDNNEFDEFTGWDDKRYKMLVQICNIFQLPLENLWPQCVVEEDVVK